MTKSRSKGVENVVILHDVRSAENVGSIFRTADASGISSIYLTGYTPAPLDRFGRPNSKVAKAALGAEQSIVWKQDDIENILAKLKQNGFQIIAVEQSNISVDYKTVAARERNAFIFGNEVDGLPEYILKKADVVAEIPMLGKKESLNISVSVGIALFRILSI